MYSLVVLIPHEVCQWERQWVLTTTLMARNALHTILALGVWQTLNHNASVEYQRTFSCYFPPEQELLRMTDHYTNSPSCLQGEVI